MQLQKETQQALMITNEYENLYGESIKELMDLVMLKLEQSRLSNPK